VQDGYREKRSCDVLFQYSVNFAYGADAVLNTLICNEQEPKVERRLHNGLEALITLGGNGETTSLKKWQQW
jgi:hypothetical protein